MSKQKNQFGQMAELLSKFQARLDSLRNDVIEHSRRISRVQDSIGMIDENFRENFSKTIDAHRMATDALLDAEKQKEQNRKVDANIRELRDHFKPKQDITIPHPVSPDVVKALNELTSSLYNLRTSTQTGFTLVKADVDKINKTLQSYNSRLSDLESKVLNLAGVDGAIIGRLSQVETTAKVSKDFMALLKSLFKEGV